jgi:hypothetical protein
MKKLAFLVISGLIYTLYSCAQTKPKRSLKVEPSLAEKESRLANQQKIDSKLLQAIKEQQLHQNGKGQNLPAEDSKTGKKGNVTVDITANVSDDLIDRIKALGGSIIFPSKQYHTIKAEISLSMVEKIASYPEVKFIEPAAVAELNSQMQPGKIIRSEPEKP